MIINFIQKFRQHNWLATIYLNFKMLPWRQAIHLPIDVYHSVRFNDLSGRIILNAERVYRGMVKLGSQGSDMFQRKGCILTLEGDMILNGSCYFGCSSTIMVRRGATLEIGNHVFLGANNLIYCEKSINIGGGICLRGTVK